MDELTKAGLAMAAELENEWGWSVGDHDTAADEFAALAVKHFAPLTDYAAFRVMRIDALTAEIAALEAAGDERPNVELTGAARLYRAASG